MTNATVPLPTRPDSPRPVRRQRRLRGWTVIGLVVALAATVGGWAWWNGTLGPLTVREHCTAIANGSTTELDPEQAGNAATIAGIANRRGLPARAASIGIATAIQESKLRNISYGDRDSLGLFQQRPSQGWGTSAQVTDPVYATNSFFDVLSEIEGFQNLPITEVAQKVQRSAFPDAYADHEPEARIIASALSGYSRAGFTCVLRPAQDTAQQPASDGLTRRALAVRTAAGEETGYRGAVAADATGRQLRFTIPEETLNRAGWSLGQWAVARAQGLSITAVQVGNRQWVRDDSADGWTKVTSASALANGVVLISVA
jgi:hypothetical protein